MNSATESQTLSTDAPQEKREDRPSEDLVVRRGKTSAEHLAHKQEHRRMLRGQMIRAVNESGAGQALAWLSNSTDEDAQHLLSAVTAALELPAEQTSVVEYYIQLQSLEALTFREKLLTVLSEVIAE